MKPSQRKLLLAERAGLKARVAEIDLLLRADDDARAAKPRKPIAPPREKVSDPRIAILREYAKQHFPQATCYNNRRKHHRTFKIEKAMTALQLEAHEKRILHIVPDAEFSRACPPYWHRDQIAAGLQSLVVVLK